MRTQNKSNGVGGTSEQLTNYQKRIFIQDNKIDLSELEQQLKLVVPGTKDHEVWPKMSITKMLHSILDIETEIE